MAALRTQLTAARATVRELRRLGRLEPVDDAVVTVVLGLAAAVDASPDNAALWRQYREAVADLRGVGSDGDPDAVQALLDALRGPEVRDPQAT